jgi:hypothetical protein
MTPPVLTSEIDGHPYLIADADAWTRSRNKRTRRRIAQQYDRKGGHPLFTTDALRRIAFPRFFSNRPR